MYTLKCPECGELMHRVKDPSPRTIEVGLTQLAYHAFREHTLERLEQMLVYTAGLLSSGRADLAELMDNMAPLCPVCKKPVTEDSYRYVRRDTRTSLCCSQECMDAVK